MAKHKPPGGRLQRKVRLRKKTITESRRAAEALNKAIDRVFRNYRRPQAVAVTFTFEKSELAGGTARWTHQKT